MLLVAVGVEGSGHHALKALLASANSQFRFLYEGNYVPWEEWLGSRLEREVLERSRRWTRTVSLPRSMTPQKRTGWRQPLALMRQSSRVGVGEMPDYQALVEGDDVASDEDVRRWVLVDSSVPFYGGWERDSLLYLDYVGMADFLSPRTTRVVHLSRSPEMASLSVYGRKIEGTLERACRSTFQSMLVVQAAVASLKFLSPLEISYEALCRSPSEVCSSLENYMGLPGATLNPEAVVPSEREPSESEKEVLGRFWTQNRKSVFMV